jgi:hypothetical protein
MVCPRVEERMNLFVCTLVSGQDLDFVRTLILDGRWDDLENVVTPLYLQPSGSFDAAGVLFHLRKQRFLELFAGGLDSDEGSVVMALVTALRSVKEVSSLPQAFNSLCYCLTLGSVTDHPDFREWTPHWGRLLAWSSVKADFERLFPVLGSGFHNAIAVGQLPRLLAQAGASVVISQVRKCHAYPPNFKTRSLRVLFLSDRSPVV